MTRAANLAKIVTDANLEGTVDVAGAFTSLGIDDNADATAITISSGEDVGIGTASPNISSVGKALTINTTSSVILELAKNGSRVANFYSDGTNASLTNNTNNALTFLTNNSERMRIDNSGNVGIGTTSPSAQLHISGTDTSDQVIIENTDTGGGSAPDLVLFRNSSSPADNDVIGRIDFRGDDDNGTARDYVTLFSTITDASTATPAGSFAIQTRNGSSQTTRLIVDGSGNVGIGTSSPDTNLDIERSSNDTGGIKVQNTNNSQGSAVAQVEISGGDNAYANLLLECNSTNHSVRQDGSGNLKFINATTERMRIDSSGNVGIGTSSPSEPLRIQSDDGGDFDPSNVVLNNALMLKNSTSGANNCITIAMATESNGEVYLSTVQNSSNNAADFAISTRDSGARAERMRIASDGNVAIGGTPDSAFRLSVNGDGSNEIGATQYRNASSGGNVFTCGMLSATSSSALLNVVGNANLVIKTNDTERMRIDGSGYIYVATGGAEPSASQVGVSIKGAQGQNFWKSANSGTSGYDHLKFFNGNGAVGSIFTNGSATTYSTSSDYRLKENVTTSWDATTRLKQLKPSRFNFIADADTTVDGFLAHEVSSIVPEAIGGTKDATEELTNVVLNADGTVNKSDISQSDWTAGKSDGTYVSDTTWVASKTVPKYQSIDQSKLVPLLVKTIQELEARITILESA
jgi:hypothetical protein